MKRSGNLMPQIADVDNLMLAFCKARRGKGQQKEVIDYQRNVVENILNLRNQLINEAVVVGNYRYFEIYDPKKRKICAAAFEERVLHHAIMNVCKERFERHLIYDTYATRDGKGVYAAIDRARSAMRRFGYVAKLDVRKYFDSINHEILKSKLQRIFKDAKLLRLFSSIIDSYQTAPNVGIPIGNLTSQYFANFYLSDFDHYVKEVLRIPCYVRYMDDMLLFADSLTELKTAVSRVNEYLCESLSLELKPAQIVGVSRGVSFLGYTIYPHQMLLNRRSKLRFVKKMKAYHLLFEKGVWSEGVYRQHLQPLLAFVEKAQTMKLRQNLYSICMVGG